MKAQQPQAQRKGSIMKDLKFRFVTVYIDKYECPTRF